MRPAQVVVLMVRHVGLAILRRRSPRPVRTTGNVDYFVIVGRADTEQTFV